MELKLEIKYPKAVLVSVVTGVLGTLGIKLFCDAFGRHQPFLDVDMWQIWLVFLGPFIGQKPSVNLFELFTVDKSQWWLVAFAVLTSGFLCYRVSVRALTSKA